MKDVDARFMAAVRAGLAGVPEAARARRARSWKSWRAGWERLLRFAAGTGFAVALGLGRIFGDEAAGRLGLAWALTAAMLGVSNALRAALFQDRDLVVFALLPAEPARVLRRQVRRGLLATVATHAAVPVAWAIIAAVRHDPPLLAVASTLFVAVAFPAASFALALASFRVARIQVFAVLAAVLPPLLAAGIAVLGKTGVDLVPWVKAHADGIAAMLPGGWIALPASALATGKEPLLFAAAAPLLLLAGSLPFLLRRLHDEHRFRDRVLAELFRQAPEDADEDLRDAIESVPERPRGRGETAIVDDLLAGTFLAPRLPAPTGFLERLAWRWWTPRQRVVADFLMLSWPAWTRWSTVGALLAVAGAVTGIVLKRLGFEAWQMAWVGGGALAMFAGYGPLGTFQPGLTPVADSGVTTSPLLENPVRPGEVAATIFKAVTLRALVLLVAAAAAGAIAGLLAGPDWPFSDAIPGWTGPTLSAAQFSLFPWVALPLVLTASLRKSVSQYRRRAAGWFAGLFYAGAILLTLFGAIGMLFPLVGLAVVAVLAGLNWLQFLVFAWLLDRGHVEGLRLAKSSS